MPGRGGRSPRDRGSRDGRRPRRRARWRRAASRRITSRCRRGRRSRCSPRSPARATRRSLGKPSPRSAFRSIDPAVSRRMPFAEPFMTSALEFGGRDRLEPDSIAGPDREVTAFGIGDAKRRRSQQVPAAGRLDGIDGRLPAGDGDRARRHPEPGRIPPREAGQSRGEIAGVRETRQETDREHVVFDPAVQVRSPRPRLRSNLAATSSRSAPS